MNVDDEVAPISGCAHPGHAALRDAVGAAGAALRDRPGGIGRAVDGGSRAAIAWDPEADSTFCWTSGGRTGLIRPA